MRKFYLLFSSLFICGFLQAQIINIPDANFKNALVNTNCVDTNGSGFGDTDADTNNDGEIQVAEAEIVLFLELDNQNIDSLDGIEAFVNLMGMDVTYNNLTSLNIDFMTEVLKFDCSHNNLTTLNWPSLSSVQNSFKCENNPNLTSVNLSGLVDSGLLFSVSFNNNLTSINAANLQTVEQFFFRQNDDIISVDFSGLTAVDYLIVSFCDSLESLNLSSLNSVTRSCVITDLGLLTDINISNVTTVGDLYFLRNDSIETAEFSSLSTVSRYTQGTVTGGGHLIMNYMPNLTSLDLGELTVVETDFECLTQVSTLNLTNLVSVATSFDISSNNLTAVDLSNLVSVGNDFSYDSNQNSTINMESLVSIGDIDASFAQLNSINLNSLETSGDLNLDHNNLSSVAFPSLVEGDNINLDYNQLTLVEIEDAEIRGIDVGYNQLTTLDLSTVTTTNFGGINAVQNPNLEALFIKNGTVSQTIYLAGNSNLKYICVDSEEYDTIQAIIDNLGFTNCVVNSYCSFVPGGEFYWIQGHNTLDSNTDGCDNTDVDYGGLKFNISNGDTEGSVISNASGDYTIALQEGSYTITPMPENPSYFSITPESIIVDFPTDESPVIQDFCLIPNGDFLDLEIFIIPLNAAVPGFDADYKMVYKNKGVTTISGTVEFNFDDNVVDFVTSAPNPDLQSFGELEWNYTDLQPFESREVFITMNFNTPTDPDYPVNGGDEIGFQSVIRPISGDLDDEDNITSIKHSVVNSFDPNDKRCLEGPTITESMVGRYVHYMVRFENTGTANAINVVIKDIIDSNKFDINTLVPLDGSHDFVTRIRNLNDVEFIFENINLPFDDASNDGYVVFKIKTLETLTLGDTFSNAAEIYFDFNFPIITNDYITTVEDNLSVNNPELNASVTLYPNPVNNTLYITSEAAIEKASIFDTNGRLIQTIVFYGIKTQRAIDLETLASGIYVIKLSSEEGTRTQKIIKD